MCGCMRLFSARFLMTGALLVVSFEPAVAEVGVATVGDRLPDVRHQILVKGDVVDRGKGSCQGITGKKQISKHHS